MKQFFTNKEDNTSVKQSIEGKSKSSACSDSDIPEIESPAVSSIKSKKCKEVPNNNNKTVPSPPTHGPSKRAHAQILNFSDSDIPGIDSPMVSPVKSKKCKEVPMFNNKTVPSPPTHGPSKRAHVQILNFSDLDIPGIDSPMVSPVKSKKCKEVPMFNNKTVSSPPTCGPSKQAQILHFSDSDIPGIDSPAVSPIKLKKSKEVPTFNSKIGSSPPTRGPSKRAQAQILNFSDSDILEMDSPAILPVKSKKSEVPTFNNRQVPSPRTSSPLKIGYKSVDFSGPVSAVSPIMKTKSQIDLNRKPFLPSKSASRKADIIYISSPSVKLTTQPTTKELAAFRIASKRTRYWVKHLYLFNSDKDILMQGRWLTDRNMNAGQKLLRNQFPQQNSLQDTLVLKECNVFNACGTCPFALEWLPKVGDFVANKFALSLLCVSEMASNDI